MPPSAGIPFAALRVISDPAHRALPELAKSAVKPNGDIDLRKVLRGIVRNPRTLRALVSTGIDFNRALRSLRSCRGFLLGNDVLMPVDDVLITGEGGLIRRSAVSSHHQACRRRRPGRIAIGLLCLWRSMDAGPVRCHDAATSPARHRSKGRRGARRCSCRAGSTLLLSRQIPLLVTRTAVLEVSGVPRGNLTAARRSD